MPVKTVVAADHSKSCAQPDMENEGGAPVGAPDPGRQEHERWRTGQTASLLAALQSAIPTWRQWGSLSWEEALISLGVVIVCAAPLVSIKSLAISVNIACRTWLLPAACLQTCTTLQACCAGGLGSLGVTRLHHVQVASKLAPRFYRRCRMLLMVAARLAIILSPATASLYMDLAMMDSERLGMRLRITALLAVITLSRQGPLKHACMVLRTPTYQRASHVCLAAPLDTYRTAGLC